MKSIQLLPGTDWGLLEARDAWAFVQDECFTAEVRGDIQHYIDEAQRLYGVIAAGGVTVRKNERAVAA